MGGMNPHGLHGGSHHGAEQMIQQTSECEGFRHENLRLSVPGWMYPKGLRAAFSPEASEPPPRPWPEPLRPGRKEAPHQNP